GKLQEALQVLDDGLTADRLAHRGFRISNGQALKYYMKGEIHLELGDLDKARREFEMSNALVDSTLGVRDRFMAYPAYVTTLVRLGKVDSARAMLQLGCSRIDATGACISGKHRMKARFNLETGDTTGCLAQVDTLLDLNLARFDDRFVWSELMLDRDPSATVKQLESLLADYSPELRLTCGTRGVRVYYLLGEAYEMVGRNEDAMASYEKFLTIWRDADPELTLVDSARTRLTSLRSGS
ncbi:MAG: tetratricopeptide repeat protein, partial [candidate division Zixibacteria bacterium]|nr:tetratricopeptide repeat protein [candidate division Zixibacteria bacterium]